MEIKYYQTRPYINNQTGQQLFDYYHIFGIHKTVIKTDQGVRAITQTLSELEEMIQSQDAQFMPIRVFNGDKKLIEQIIENIKKRDDAQAEIACNILALEAIRG